MKKKTLVLLLILFSVFSQSSKKVIFADTENKKTIIANKFEVQPLPYAYDALEPYIDKETMLLHHDKHYKAYVDKLNLALDKYPELYNYSLTDLLKKPDLLPNDVRQAIINNGGGKYNHEFFFNIMTPNKTTVSDKLKEAIDRDFGSYDNFKSEFSDAALSVFGSGWAWLVTNPEGKLSIITTSNQDTPLSLNLKPVIGIDVWEHAYYLKYKNERNHYIDNWFNVINWDQALINYTN